MAVGNACTDRPQAVDVPRMAAGSCYGWPQVSVLEWPQSRPSMIAGSSPEKSLQSSEIHPVQGVTVVVRPPCGTGRRSVEVAPRSSHG